MAENSFLIYNGNLKYFEMNGGNIDSFIILSDFDSMNPIILILSESVKGIDIELDKKNELRFC